MFIKGVGCTRFGIENIPSQILVHQAVMEALEDAGLGMNNIDAAVMSATDITTNGERQRHPSSMLSSLLQKNMPILDVPNFSCGGGTALWTAIRFGMSNANLNNILVVGYDKAVANTKAIVIDEMSMAAESLYEQREGINIFSQNALIAQQYMLKYGATKDDFALVAYKNHNNAALNPKSRFHNKKILLQEIKNSRTVSEPLRAMDCYSAANGASAAIISKEKTDVEIIGSSLITDSMPFYEHSDITSFKAAKLAAEQAYKQAGIEPSQIDIAEVHDAFTPAEIISYEDLGFAKKGQGSELIRKATTMLDGRLPVNTSGGLKAKGHPISATGLGQIYELAKQLRGEAKERQVQCKFGIAQNIGGAGSMAAVHILSTK